GVFGSEASARDLVGKAPDEVRASERPLPGRSGTGVEMEATKQAIASGAYTTADISERLGLPRKTVIRRLNSLIDRGEVERTGSRNSPKQSYRLVGEEETP
ncbi:MAG: helix-turn-helix domain-containing protein, partial [Brevibacterium sp.]|nr:helix-turn-helix domain-containing protein [Brevibacterium sp.]